MCCFFSPLSVPMRRQTFTVYKECCTQFLFWISGHVPPLQLWRAIEAALSNKYSKFPIYNTKSRGKRDTTRNIPRMYSIWFLRCISFYILENLLPLVQWGEDKDHRGNILIRGNRKGRHFYQLSCVCLGPRTPPTIVLYFILKEQSRGFLARYGSCRDASLYLTTAIIHISVVVNYRFALQWRWWQWYFSGSLREFLALRITNWIVY